MKQTVTFMISAIIAGNVCARALIPVSTGDLASGDTWSGGSRPESGDSVTIDLPGTYTASQDLSFQAITVTASDVTFDFTATPGRKIELLSTQEHLFERRTANDATNTYKGGLWCTPNNAGDAAFFVAGSGRHRQMVKLTDGCVVSNLNRVLIYNSQGSQLLMSGGSRFYTKEFLASYGSGPGCVVRVTDGSSIICKKGFYGHNAKGDGYADVIVSGIGSSIVSEGDTSWVASMARGSSISVVDGATARFYQLIVGYGEDYGMSSFAVTNGAFVEIPTQLHLRGAGSSVLVDNASLKFSSMNLGSGCAFTMRGANAAVTGVVEHATFDFFTSQTTNSLFVMENGAKFIRPDLKYHFSCAYACTGCVARLEGEGTKVCVYNGGETFTFGQGNGVSNRFEILSGATLDIGQMRIAGLYNTLVVSNGTVTSTGDNGVWEIGFKKSNALAPTNALVVLQGSRPRFESKNTVAFRHGARLRVQIPRNGLEKGWTPIKVTSLEGSADTLEIECEEFAAHTGGSFTLAEVQSKGALDSWIQALSPRLPPDCRLSYTDNKLLFWCPRRKGTAISLR